VLVALVAVVLVALVAVVVLVALVAAVALVFIYSVSYWSKRLGIKTVRASYRLTKII